MHLEIVYIDDEGGWEIEGEFRVNLPYYLCNPYIRQISGVYLSDLILRGSYILLDGQKHEDSLIDYQLESRFKKLQKPPGHSC